jgi:spermidine synthase
VRHRGEALLFCVALGLLALEVSEIRVFSYAMDPRLVYGVIGLAMLGMGVSAVAGSLRPTLLQEERAPTYATLMGVTGVLSLVIFSRVSASFDATSFGRFLLTGAPMLLLCAVPYAFAGLALVTLQLRGEEIGRRYRANLAGSALGCFVVPLLIRAVGLERLLVGIAVLPVIAALVVDRRRRHAGALVALLLAIPAAKWLLPFEPDPQDLYASAERSAKKLGLPRAHRDFAAWDPVARVEVFQFPGPLGVVNNASPLKVLLHDGGAGSLLFGRLNEHQDIARALFEGSTYGGAYAVHDHARNVLVIGLGGAPDIMTAKHFGAQTIVGVEVNGATLDVVRKHFKDFLNDPYGGVELHHADGRSFVEGEARTFDLVQISGTDTWSAGSAGAFMFSESYLYTSEAIQSFLRVLAPDGMLTMIRFGPEPLRLVATEVEAARKLGFARPSQHFVVLGQGTCQSVVFSKQPITEAQLRRVAQHLGHARTLPKLTVPLNSALMVAAPELPPLGLVYAPGVASDDPVARYLRTVDTQQDEAFIAKFPFDVTPVSDDRPFFFQFLGPRQLGRLIDAPPDDFFARGLREHFMMLVGLTILSIGILFGPLRIVRAGGAFSTLAYFGLIGAAFLLVELALVQRTALTLGHPAWSVTVTLFALLLSSAVGAAYAERLGRRAAILLFVAIAALVLVPHSAVALVLKLPFAVRVVAIVLAIAPLGIAMGTYFPNGIRAVAPRGPSVVAWAQASNACASVVASLLTPVLAMLFGFRVVLLIALVLYAIATVITRPAPGSGETAHPR